MNKKEAAEFLGCSPRQLERYTKENKIGVRYEKGRTRPTPVYDEGELRHFKEKLERPVYRPAVERAGAVGQPIQSIATQDDGVLSLLSQSSQIETLARLLEAVGTQAAIPQKPSPPDATQAAAKLLLTLSECQTLTGLSRATLRAAIDAKQLKAKQIGRAWRVKRVDIENYVVGL
jgi:excisionase family DNA binding protein